MGSLRIAHNNLVWAGGTILEAVSFSENASYPVENAVNGRASSVYRTAAAALSTNYAFTYDFGAAVTVNFVALINCNLRSTDELTIAGDDDNTWPGGGDYSQAVTMTSFGTNNGLYNVYCKLAADQTYRYWRFLWNDQGTAQTAGYWQIGEVYIGTCITPSGSFDWPYHRIDDHHTIAHETEWGNRWTYRRQNRLAYRISFSNIPDSDITLFRTAWGTLQGDRYPFLMVPDDSYAFSLWGRFGSSALDETKRFNANDLQFDVTEEPRGIAAP